MSYPLQLIKSRGYWQVEIRPLDFREDRIADLGVLDSIILKARIEAGGYSVPCMTVGTPSRRGINFVAQSLEQGQLRQSWRFYQSGQLILFEAFMDDWFDEAVWPGRSKNSQMSLSDTLYTYWVVFELASRLALGPAGGDSMFVRIEAFGLKDRALISDVRQGATQQPAVAEIPSFPFERTLARQELVATAGDIAIEGARQLMSRFGRDEDSGTIRSLMARSGGGARHTVT